MISMIDYKTRIQRIINKLPLAKAADPNYKAFGADSHKYKLNAPATLADVTNFEEKYGIQLPECYRSFILQVGNGGVGYANSAAGPFYGIYPIGTNVNELIYDTPEKYLKNACVISPEMSDEYWKELTAVIRRDEDIADDVFDTELGRIYSGILPIGSQGCTYLHCIIINGPYKGLVVNIDVDAHKPQFTFESNFLDWYERWLDEVISGELQSEDPGWFGYAMGGSAATLIEAFQKAGSVQEKTDCLEGILKKNKVDKATILIIEEEFLASTGALKTTLLQILTRFDYEKAKPYLLELGSSDLLSVFQFVYWYAKGKSEEWHLFICEHMEKVKDDETFRYCTYVLEKCSKNYGQLIVPFTKNDNENIRVTAFYTLGKVSNKKNYLDNFIEGLNDSSNRVIHITLQALDGVKDVRLLEHYKRIAKKFPIEKDYILSNLNHRLADYGLNNKTIMDKETVSNWEIVLLRFKNWVNK